MRYLVLLFIAMLTLGSLPVATMADAPPEATPWQTLTYDEAMGNAMHFKRLVDAIPDEQKVGITSQAELDQWTKEIVPYFEYEGIVLDGDPNQMGSLIYPTEIHFEDYQDGLMSHHVLGTTSVFTDEITINDRVSNPVSPWFGRIDSPLTLVHELCHAQGIKFPAPYSDLDEESSAQLCALETMAAMVNNGNERALAPLLYELFYMNMQAARYLAYADDDMDRYFADRNTLLTNPFDRANAAKSDRQWAKFPDPEKYPYILYAYNYMPMDRIARAAKYDGKIYGVRLPINLVWDTFHGPYAGAGHYPGGYGEVVEPSVNHISYDPAPLPLVIDDLLYIYQHADELAAGLY